MLDISEGALRKSEEFGRRPGTPPTPGMKELMLAKLGLPELWPNNWPPPPVCPNNDSRDISYSDLERRGPVLWWFAEQDTIEGLSFSFASIGSGLVLGVETISVEATSMLIFGEWTSKSREFLSHFEPSRSFRSRSDFLHLALRFYKRKGRTEGPL